MGDEMHCPPDNCNIMQLLPLLLDTDTDEEITISPSKLMYELQMSTEERLERLCRATRKYRIVTELNTFSRTPDIVVFQNFKENIAYTTTLSLLNQHTVSRHLRIIRSSSPYFKITYPAEDSSMKVAPGMSYNFNITFLPLENRDYAYEVTFLTDGETFKVSLYGIGPRPLLNLPDHIELPKTAVRVASEKSLILHNFGKAPASFVISCQSPFGVHPCRDILDAGGMMELKINCNPSSLGSMKSHLDFFYGDIKLKVTLGCEAASANVYLEKDSLVFENTYMGLKRQTTVTVRNETHHHIDFQWKLYKSYAIDQLETSKMVENISNVQELQKKKCHKLERMNIIDYEGHCSICDRSLEDEIREMDSHNLHLYKNLIFDILPLTGQILPKHSVTFTVVFSPQKNELYESWAYLDVTGREDRPSLNLHGLGIGPYVVFNVKVLNINDVFICASHQYELVVKNEGNIPATVIFNETDTDFGGTITCTPKKMHLRQQNVCEAFFISFYSKIQGKFLERIEFTIKESGEILHVVLTGNVVCPLLKLNVKEIDFGIVPFGFKKQTEFKLINDSQVPIDFNLKMEEANNAHAKLYDGCNVIVFVPDRGIVDAYSDEMVQVELATGAVEEVDNNMKVNMWGSKSYSISIPLKYNCVCPKITCTPTKIYIKFCFLSYEYKRIITLMNNSDVPGFITYTPTQETKEAMEGISCVLNRSECMINPYEKLQIEISITVTVLGLHEFPLMFTLAGSKPEEMCRILCNGQGPVVSYSPDELNFGQILLLNTVTKVLSLINDSPIKAILHIATSAHSFFEIDVNDIEIDPEDSYDMVVSAYLTDTGKYKGTINVNIENGEKMKINVNGVGVGYSIESKPVLTPEYDAQTLLTYQQFDLPVTFSNLGKKFYQIRWCRTKFLKNLLDPDEVNPKIQFNFKIEPDYFDVESKTSQTFHVYGYSKKPQVIQEEFFCHAAIDKANLANLIMSFVVKAKFIEPNLEITKPELSFLVSDAEEKLEDTISFINDTDIPLAVNFYTSNDYYLVNDDEKQESRIHCKIESKETYTTKVIYEPYFEERRYYKKEGTLTVDYAKHPKSTKVPLTAIICYPTVKIIPSEYNFQCLPLNSHSYTNIIIQNITYLPVSYKWQFEEDFFKLEALMKTETKTNVSEIAYVGSESSSSEEIEEEEEEKLEEAPEEDKTDIEPPNVEEEPPPIPVEEIKVIWEKERYYTALKKMLVPVIEELLDDDDSDMIETAKEKDIDIEEYKMSDVLTIEPFEGYLEPYEYVIFTVGFFPPLNMRVGAKAICNIEDGEHETLTISGTCSKISYLMDKDYIEFGRTVFCEICKDKIVLKNNGHCCFNFFIKCDYENDGHTILEPGWLNVKPKTKFLRPGETVALQIKYFPGVAGEFYTKFLIEIGYFEPMAIKMHGFAVFSQLFIAVPRPLIREQSSDVMYDAVSTITMGYLRTLEKINNINIPSYYNIPGCPADVPKIPCKLLKKDGWAVISKDNIYPSEMDMDLSVERMLIRQHVLTRDNVLLNHTFQHKVITIPGFVTPPYILDFGYVVVERRVCYTVLLLNYGPVKTTVKMLEVRHNTLLQNQFKIEFKPKPLKVAEIMEVFVIFSPTAKRYTDLDEYVEDKFSLIVRHGATIPIAMKAIVTLPRLVFEHACVDFGAVQMGDSLRRSVVIHNNGYVSSKWDAEMTMKKKLVKDAYFIRPSQGELEPGRKQLIDIYFVPKVPGFAPAQITVYIEGNPETSLLRMCGNGIEATLAFSQNTLNFKSTLPYSQENAILLLIQNVSTSPIEFCFTDFDQDYEEEKIWIDTFLSHYSLKRVFIPHRAAGDKLPDVFQGNYLSLISKLRQKLMKENRDEAGELENFDDPLLNRSPDEIIQLIKENVEPTQIEKDMVSTDHMKVKDNFFLSTTVLEPERIMESDPNDQRPGIFIIFHGGPNTELFKASNRTGITLSLPVYSIDRLIYDCLVEDASTSANDINTKINETFAAAADEEDITPVPGEDEYDKCEKKVFVVLTKKPKKPAKKGKGGKESEKSKETESKASDKKPGKQKITDTLIDIPLALFVDVLATKLKSFTYGVIIESLTSNFLRKPQIALDALLRSIGNIKHIHFVILSYSLKDYLKDEEDRIIAEEMAIEAERLANAPKVEPGADKKKDKKGDKGKSASSKSSKSKGKPNYTKQILKDMPPPLKQEFDSFEEVMKLARQMYDSWDRRHGVLVKLQGTKSSAGSKTDIKGSTKDSTKDSKMSTKRKRTSSDVKSAPNPAEIGLTFWLINNAKSDRPIDFTETICQSMRDSIELKEAKEDIEESLKEHVVESSEMFSVIPKLKRRRQTVSDLFIVSNRETIAERSDRDAYALVASKTSSELGPRRRKSGGSKKRRSIIVDQQSVTSSEKAQEVFTFTPRCILQPGDIAQYRVAFYPKLCGVYDCNFAVEIIGLKTVYPIKCHAACEIPRIDFNPDIVFPRTLENYRDKCFYDNFVYIKDENVLDFGAILYHPEIPYIYECNLLLKNIAQQPCDVSAHLSDTSQYSLKSEELRIEPGCEDKLTIRIRANTIDFIDSNLYISTKNNPKVEMIRLVTKPCQLEFDVKPKSLIYDKVALNHSVVRLLTLINSSPISLWWKFVAPERALEKYEISEIQNTLMPYSIADITVAYTPIQEEIVAKENLEIQAFDLSLSKETPIFTEFISLQAEGVEYIVEYLDHIDLGEMKGGIPTKIPFNMVNKGKSQVCVTISDINSLEDLDVEIRQLFKVTNQSTTIQPQKTFTYNVLFSPMKDMEFKEVPIFLCSFVECDDREKIIKSFPVKISAVVFMSSVELCPETNIHFGYQKVMTTKKQIMEIKNDGTFPFEYKIVSLKQELALKNKAAKKGKGGKDKSKSSDKSSKKESSKKSESTKSKSTKDSKSKDGKKGKEKSPKARKPTKLNVDCFSIISSTGDVLPDQTVEVQVECTPRIPKEYEEIIIVYVSEPKEHEVNGKYVTLSTTACEPSLNFADYTKMFTEQFVVDKMENFICPKNIGSHCIFVSSEETLHFKRVCINTTCTSNVSIQNVGHVMARVTTRILDGSTDVFTVSPSILDIGPYESEVVSITFMPESIEEFDKKLEITCDSSSNNKFILSLNGEGLIPQTALLDPKINENDEYTIDFIPTYLGFSRSKKIRLKNIGLLSSKVILEVCININEALHLVASDETMVLLNIPGFEELRSAKYSTLVNLQPKQCAEFDLVFNPKCEQVVSTDIKIHTVNNPFELIKMAVNAQSYYHNVYMDKLSPRTNSTMPTYACVGYDLDFGFSILNSLQKKYFTIKNNSDVDVYKFEFSKFRQLMFIPRVGHLKPFASKEIIVTFSTKRAIHFDRVMIQCNLNTIEYVHPELEGLSWDERQQFSPDDVPCLKPSKETLPEGSKTPSDVDEERRKTLSDTELSEYYESKVTRTDDRPEPEITIVPEKSDVIPVYFSIVADYSSYTGQVCDLTSLNFPGTLLKEKSEMTFEIENNGAIPLQISWTISNYEIIPTSSSQVNTNKEAACYAYKNVSDEKSSSKSTSLFSSECCHCLDEVVYPFTVTPESTSICPSKIQVFSVFFTPINLAQYTARLESSIVCLHPQLSNLEIKLTAASLMPTYYFELEESDYMNRRPDGVQTCVTQYYPNPKIVEFESVGIGIQSVRMFNLVNPTNEVISFKFESLETNPHFSYFTCKNPNSFVLDDKKLEIVMTFEAQEFGHFEGYYMFHLQGKDVQILFLLAGNCRPPKVYFTSSKVEIQPTVLTVEVKAVAVLRNEEEIELTFRFENDSLFNENHDQQLGVSPMYGKIPAKSDINICLTYLAERVGDVSFYLTCFVERAKMPVNLNVTAKCLEILPSVTYVNKDGKCVTLLKNRENLIDFGNVNPKKADNIQFTISNTGLTGFFYSWHFNKKPIEHLFEFSMDNKKGFLPSNNECISIMTLEALLRSALRDFKVKLNISYGPTYALNIRATAEKPLCSFSFREHNFGYCIVQKRKTDYYTVGLEFKNFGIRLLTLENCFVNSDDVTIDFKSAQVPSCFSQHVSIYFHPRKVGQYKISLPFIVDSIKYVIRIKGEAVKVDLQLVSISDKYVDLENVMVGTLKQYTVQVVNNTPTAVNAFFDLWERLPFQSRPCEKIETGIKVPEIPPPVQKEKKEKKGKEDKGSKSTKSSKTKDSKKDKKSKSAKNDKDKKKKEPAAVVEPVYIPPPKTVMDFLRILPKDCITIPSNKKCEFIIDFYPTERLEHFSKQIFYETQDYVEPLCIVKGCCIAPDFALNNYFLTFSNVVVGCRHTMSVILKNTGDIKGRFKWTLDQNANIFKITPNDGFISPASEMKIWISFEPRVVECLYKAKKTHLVSKIRNANICLQCLPAPALQKQAIDFILADPSKIANCAIENVEKPLELMLSGNSVKIPNPTSIVALVCPVREKVEQKVMISNPAKNAWTIYPVISSKQFSTLREIKIEPGMAYPLTITYHPQQMTTLNPHNGILFLPLPEGQAIVYQLTGNTLPPLPLAKMQIEIGCKQNYMQVLSIENWLPAKQCFRVSTELTSSITTKSLYKVSGKEFVELFPEESKEYLWSIYVINEIPLSFKVIFTNTETEEYMFYDISVKVLPSGPLETVDLITCVREVAKATIKLQNPIDLPVTFTIECNFASLTFEKLVEIPAYTTHNLEIIYRPLKTEAASVNFVAKCAELGVFTYCLNLVSNPPVTEAIVKFTAELGERRSKLVFFKNTFSSPVDFSATFDYPMFSMEKAPPIPVGETGKITFVFEPNNVGELRSKTILTSPVTGEYIYPLIGYCHPPLPKGPFYVRLGGSTVINFVNPFEEQKTFNYIIDSDMFFLKIASELLKPKKPTKIIVSMLPTIDVDLTNMSVSAKLVVNCDDSELQHVKWVYYIQGEH